MNLQTVNANLSRVPFFRFLNFEVQSLDNLHAAAEMTFESRHIGNPVMEHYHGGIIASFMEAIAAIAVRPDFEEAPAKPINLTVDYLRPAVKGPLYTHANVTRKGKRIASVSVISWQTAREKPIAEGLYHFLLV
ncbi:MULTISPECIES: PaaI family thioesterase [Halomonadaceae]|uniref:PaaI family thioesterase n=1 Tax=Halomonadaceae TaxID=28256 RepID=UPI0007818990|nr:MULTISPECIES: PaaI family thioesterase [Halomonas]MAO58494.1 PaaI family thioesterase [Alcanivorax sp.]MAY08882.1 PaaI family thioesterase [Alcanivorax sp.]MBI55560.1 PaaI family thioesterase [Alcanivorax sp.]|tara:strand:+ start:143 stop:544 length:402 start_codon:yes stop_codon:yes gene_type:complete